MSETPYLIQRMSYQRNPPKNPSFDGLLKMDYMGSSEFEFDSLPTSLKQLTRNHSKLVVEQAEDVCRNEAGERMFLIGLPEVVADYQQYMNPLYKNEIRLKEATYLNLEDRKGELVHVCHSWDRTDVWWDINNHVIFCFGKSNAEAIIKAIGVVRANKEKDGKTEWL